MVFESKQMRTILEMVLLVLLLLLALAAEEKQSRRRPALPREKLPLRNRGPPAGGPL